MLVVVVVVVYIDRDYARLHSSVKSILEISVADNHRIIIVIAKSILH